MWGPKQEKAMTLVFVLLDFHYAGVRRRVQCTAWSVDMQQLQLTARKLITELSGFSCEGIIYIYFFALQQYSKTKETNKKGSEREDQRLLSTAYIQQTLLTIQSLPNPPTTPLLCYATLSCTGLELDQKPVEWSALERVNWYSEHAQTKPQNCRIVWKHSSATHSLPPAPQQQWINFHVEFVLGAPSCADHTLNRIFFTKTYWTSAKILGWLNDYYRNC